MRNWVIIFLAVVVIAGAKLSIAADQEPLRLSNGELALRFDRQTGDWIRMTDLRSGDELITRPGPQTTAFPPVARMLNKKTIQQAVASKQVIALDDTDWLYTSKPPLANAAAAYLQGHFQEGTWEKTHIPSRRGSGDDRLHQRFGDFFYRREFTIPAQWQGKDLVLILGAVDDFDATYINGTEIGSTDLGTPYHWKTARLYRVPAKVIYHDRVNTLLIKVTNGSSDGGIDGPVVIGLASALAKAEISGSRLLHSLLTHDRGVATLLMVTASNDYEFQVEYCLPDNQDWFSRQMTVYNKTAAEIVLANITCATPPIGVGPHQGVIFPGSLPIGNTPLDQPQWLKPRGQDPLAILWDATKKRGLGTWYACEEEFAPVSVRRSGMGAEIRHVQRITARLQPGKSITLGKQFFWLAHGARDDALKGVQKIYQAIGLHAPDHALDGLGAMVMYCGHPGGTPERQFRGYGGFTALGRYVPTLKRMGTDLLWLLPIWEHGDTKKWNLYAPFDHFRISSLYGTAEELKELSAIARQSGIRLMFDLVPHGPPDFTPLAQEHPEWISLNHKGDRIYAWQEYAFDNGHPGWQDYMRRVAEWDARQYQAVGARVDCGAGGPPNWNPAVSDRPSHSTLAGGLGMNRAIREGFLQVENQVVLMPEEYQGANIFYRVADLTYDAQLYFLQVDLHAHNASPEEWARSLQQFLHDQQITLPPDALKMRWISNHDTVNWTFQKQRPIRLYGVEKTRALLAICALIEGVPMLYQGDEDPAIYGGQGESSVDFLARIYSLRKQLSAIGHGQADYQSVQASGGVFACLRQTASPQALVLVSLNPQAVKSQVSLPASYTGRWTDVLSGEVVQSAQQFHVAMNPYQVRVLVRSDILPLKKSNL